MNWRVLLVDDEPQVLRGLRRVLSEDSFNWDVRTAGGADEALAQMRQADFDAADEWQVMKRHCVIGAGILREDSRTMRVYRAWYGNRRAGRPESIRNPLLELASSIALTHHEWWDGTGYPAGLAGQDIPLASRIVALADTYDALRSERPYKPAMSEDETSAIIRDECGRHLDPEVCAAFEHSARSFGAVRSQFSDPPARPVEAEYVT